MATEKLRDLSQPIDVAVLDATVAAFFVTGSKEENMETKFFALQVLEGVIKYRWNSMSVEQRDGMKKYIWELLSNEASFNSERLYVNKLNVILVEVVKHDWPAKWTSFIPDLVAAAKTSETICENCMDILKLLSEKVFGISRGEMTLQNIEELKQSLGRHVGVFEYLIVSL